MKADLRSVTVSADLGMPAAKVDLARQHDGRKVLIV